MKYPILEFVASSTRSTPALIVCFSIGIVSIRFLPVLPEPIWIVAFALLSYISLLRFRFAYFFLALVFGICWASWHAVCFQARMIPVSLEKEDIVVVGVISSLVEVDGNVSSFDFDVASTQHKEKPVAKLGTIRLKSYQAMTGFKSGERWQFTVRLKRPRSLLNPGVSFDLAAWMYSKGCLLYTSPSPRDRQKSRMPSSA